LLLVFAATGCGGAKQQSQPQQTQPRVVWRALGSWSGHGNKQTESFTSDTGTLRVTWETTVGTGAPPSPPAASRAEAAYFRLNAHSAISGRLLQPVVDTDGAGSGVGYVQQDPHVFYMVVESAGLNWKFTVEEAIGYP
jgi:hypothetical protein